MPAETWIVEVTRGDAIITREEVQSETAAQNAQKTYQGIERKLGKGGVVTIRKK